MTNKRISIFTGHFGSGKTEVAVNYALKLAAEGKKTTIVDCDIVNPFFRTADAKSELESKGIKVITTVYANSNVDVPALPGDITSIFENLDTSVVFDVGGDDLGAKAISRYSADILKDDYELFMVINARRIRTDSIERIEQMIWEIENSARIKVTKLVNNTNVLDETTVDIIMQGQELIESLAKKLKVSIGFISGMSHLTQGLNERTNHEILSLNKFIKLPWE